MILGYRTTLALLALPFVAIAAASIVQSYRSIAGANVAKSEPLPPIEDFAKSRERTLRSGTAAQSIGAIAFAFSPEETAETLPDDMRKLARGTAERNQVWENLRIFLTEPKAAKYKGTLAKSFENASK